MSDTSGLAEGGARPLELELTRFCGHRHAFVGGVPHGQDQAPYAPEFRQQIIELARAGRDPASLAREVEPSAQAIRNWIAQADRAGGRRETRSVPVADGEVLAGAERDELARLRREVRQLRVARA